MKTILKVAGTLLAAAMGLALVSSITSCASTSGSKTGGPTFLGDYAKDLQPGPRGGVKELWLKPGVDFAKYNKVILEHVIFFFDDTSESKAIDTSELNEIARQCDLALFNALKVSYPIVTEPGPDVVRIRFAITDLRASNAGIFTVTMVNPIGLSIDLIKKGATGSWVGSGSTKVELLAFDSMTNEVIAAAKDDRSAGLNQRYTKWESTEEAFKFWGERTKKFMDQVHGTKTE